MSVTGIGQSSYVNRGANGYSKSSSSSAKDGKKKGKIDVDELYAFYDRGRKSVADFIAEYQNVSNYNYYKTTSDRLDYRYRLIDLYEYCMLDLHLTSVVDSLFHQIIGERYSFKDENGDIDYDATKLIRNSWFVNYIRGVIEAKLFGYTLMELGDYNEKTGTLEEVRQIERRNVAPKNNLVLEYPQDTVGWDITDKKLKGDYVLIDGQEGFGWLLKALPIVMSKRFALSSHTQYAETYGIPMIVGKSTDDSYEEKANLANEIAAARDSRVIITGLEDEITFLNQISNDTNKIYTELVRLTNDEVTMLILGQSATTESQAYVGSAEIQYRVMVDRVQAIREYVTNHINEELVWRLRDKGLDIPENVTFGYSNVMEMSPDQQKDLFDVLLRSYEVSPEEIYETFGVTVGRQILEESNDQLLTYQEETVKERGNPDNAEAKDPEVAKKMAREEEKKKEEQITQGTTEASVNFFDSSVGCDFNTEFSEIDKKIVKLESSVISEIGLANKLRDTYSSYHSHSDIVSSLEDDINGFNAILEDYLSRIFNGDPTAFNEAHQKLTQYQYDILSDLFTENYGYSIDSLKQDENEEDYAEKVAIFLSSFAASKQLKVLKTISDLAARYANDYQKFVDEALKTNTLFNKVYHTVEGDTMKDGYSFAKTWRNVPDGETILQYGTQADDRVRPDHAALDGIKMRKSEWANSSFLPPWQYGCRCYLFDTGTTDGRQLTNSRKLPSDDIVPPEFRTNTGETGAVFSKYHPYYEDLTGNETRYVRNSMNLVKK